MSRSEASKPGRFLTKLSHLKQRTIILTRLASIPTLIILLVALFTTKVEILANDGFWEMMHASRTDWAMLLGSLLLIVKGGWRFLIDWVISSRKDDETK